MIRQQRTRPNFPPDLAALFAPYWIVLPVLLVSARLWTWMKAAIHDGDLTLLWVAIAFGAVGSAFLFLAKLPLYRRGQFLRIGPGSLDHPHRLLYRWAYFFVSASIGLLFLLIFLPT